MDLPLPPNSVPTPAPENQNKPPVPGTTPQPAAPPMPQAAPSPVGSPPTPAPVAAPVPPPSAPPTPAAPVLNNKNMRIDDMLVQATSAGASDLHLQVGRPPIIRESGSLADLPGYPAISENGMLRLAEQITTEEQRKDYGIDLSIDFSHSVPGVARFRVNILTQMGKMGAVFRRIPEEIPTLADLAAPAALLEFSRMPRGLVLVTGPTGSGKSTTLAAVIDAINSDRPEHILTIEDPIEFVHPTKKSLINQREIGRDTPDFKRALRDALREDPDVILVGEMRDNETISIAMSAAETGHLVFGTLHTSSAPSTIDRIIDSFPSEQQSQIRTMLSNSLVGVVTQTLVPKKSGKGRVAAHEVLVVNNAVSAMIRSGQVEQIRSTIQTGSKSGMQTMDRALAFLVEQDIIDEETARSKSQDANEFDQYMKGMAEGKPITPPKLILPNRNRPQPATSVPTPPVPPS